MPSKLGLAIVLWCCACFQTSTLRASAGGEAFNPSSGSLNVDYAGYMSKQDIVYGAPVTNPVEGLTVGQGKVGMMVWSQNGLTMQISGVDDSEQGAFSEGLINLVTSPGMDTNYSNFLQRLSLFNGTLSTSYDSNRTVTIMGAPNSEVMGIHVNDTRTGVTAVTLQLSMWNLANLTNSGNVPNLATWQTVSTYANATSAGFSRGQADPNNFGYTLAATVDGTPFTTQVVSTGTTPTVQLNITPATSYTIWISCASRLDAPNNNSVAQAATELSSVTGTYTATLAAYQAWWNAFWKKSFVEFSNSTGYADYVENLYYLATYMIASGGYGSYPFHFINGVFRATQDSTKWSNAYWYWNQRDVYNSFLASNHPDMMNVFNNLYARNAAALQTQTSGRYKLSGTWVPETMGFNGNDSGTIGSSYTDNIYSSGTEAAENMYRQYQYTNNYAYLTGTAYPFMKQVCTFYANILATNANGQYYIPKVVDGSFGDNAHETYWNVQDAITDLAAIRELFPDTIAAAQLQGTDSALVTQLQNILSKLVPYPVDPGNSGQYYACDPPLPSPSNDENVTCELAWPYGMVGLSTPDLSFGVNNWNNRPFPYNNVWAPDAIQAARLGLGNQAFQGMQTMMETYQNYPNGMTNNTNGVFEYLGVNLSALNESLMQSYNGTIRVFPAPTTDSSMVSKFTLAARGGFLVSSENEAGELKYVGINSLYGNPCSVANPWGTQQLDVRQVSNNAIVLTSSASTISFNTAANTVYVIEPSSKPLSSYAYEQITASQNQAAKTMAGNQLGTYSGPPPPPVNGLYTAKLAGLTGTAGLSGDQAAVGGYEVVDMSQGASITFSNVVSGTKMVIQYCTENNPGKLDLYINGTLNQAITFPDTNSWSGTYAQVTLNNLSIPSGATVKLQYDSGDSGANINYVQILGGATPTPTSVASPTATQTKTATMTPTATATATKAATAAATTTPTATWTATPTATAAAPGVIASYGFNGNASDSSGNGYALVANGSPAYSSGNCDGSSASEFGPATDANYYSEGAPFLSAFSNLGSYTISAYFNAANLGDQPVLFSWTTAAGTWNFLQILSGGGFSLELNGVSVQTASLVATGSCHAVKLVQSGTTASLYLDGTLATTLSDGGGTGAVSAFYAGRWTNGTGYSFDGTLEDLAISNVALAPTPTAGPAPIRVACVGASITWGYCASNQSTTSYPAVLQNLLGSGYTVQNDGDSGAGILKLGQEPYWGSTEYNAAVAFNPNIVVIDLGANDTKPIDWQYNANIAADYVSLVNVFRNLPSHPTVYMALPCWVQLPDYGITEDIVGTYLLPGMIQIANQQNLCMIDMYDALYKQPQYFCSDGVHLNDSGYALMAQTVYNAITQKVACYEPATPIPTPVATPTLAPANYTWRVNSGGPAYTDSIGNLWSADCAFTGGTTDSTSSAIAGTADQTLYKTERQGDVVTYAFQVPAGYTYNVTLKVAEIDGNTATARQQNVYINGNQVLTNFDCFSQVGADKADDQVFSGISPNALNQIFVQFGVPTAGNSQICAIQVVPNGTPPTLTSTPLQDSTASATATITATATASAKATATPTTTLTPTQTVAVTPGSSWHVRAGGPAYTDILGQAWLADTDYSGGTTGTTTHSISAPGSDPVLYQSERWGNPFTYTFPVNPGTYQVTLKFAEIYWTAAGDRVFDASINGTQVITNLDIFSQVGEYVADDKVFNNIQPNSSGQIVIELGPASVDNAKVAAIAIIPQPATPTPAATQTPSLSPSKTLTLVSTPTPTPTLTPTLTPTRTAVVTPGTSWHVRAGGAAYTDTLGQAWLADTDYSGGTASSTTHSISAPGSDPALYQSERWGNPFTYTFPVNPGSYQVTLKMAEIYWTAAGERVFDASINGTQVITNLDIFSQVGAYVADDKVFNNIQPNSSGQIVIELGPASVDNAKVAAIAIVPQPSTPTATRTSTLSPTSSFTLTATRTQTPTATATAAASGVIAAYAFNGNAADSSGDGYALVANGSPAYTAGNCDGTSSSEYGPATDANYYSEGAPFLSAFSNLSTYTISAWFNAANLGDQPVLFSWTTSAGTWNFLQILSGGGFSLELNGVSVQTASLVATGACHAVKLVQSGTTASLYLDGTLETTLSDGAGTGTVSAFYVGRWANGTGYAFDGSLEDLVLSNVANTQGSLQASAVRRPGLADGVATGKLPTSTPGSLPGGKELLLAPNPASSHNVAEIDLPQPATTRLVVLDLDGRCVETRDLGLVQAGITAHSLDLSSEAPGIYFLSLQTDTGQGYAPAALFKFAVLR